MKVRSHTPEVKTVVEHQLLRLERALTKLIQSIWKVNFAVEVNFIFHNGKLSHLSIPLLLLGSITTALSILTSLLLGSTAWNAFCALLPTLFAGHLCLTVYLLCAYMCYILHWLPLCIEYRVAALV